MRVIAVYKGLDGSIVLVSDMDTRRETFEFIVPHDDWADLRHEFDCDKSVAWYYGKTDWDEEGLAMVNLCVCFKPRIELARVQDRWPNSDWTIRATDTAWGMLQKIGEIDGELISSANVPTRFKNKLAGVTKAIAVADRLKIMFDQPTLAAATAYAKDNLLTEYTFKNGAMMAALESNYAVPTRMYDMASFNRPPIDAELFKRKTVILTGTTGLGKTEYAKAHFNKPLLITGKEDWAKLRSRQHDGVVIDDITCCDWQATNVLSMCDVENPRTVNIKYGSATIPAGMPRIMTVNTMNLFWPKTMEPETKQAILRRICIINIRTSLISPKYGPLKRSAGEYDDDEPEDKHPCLKCTNCDVGLAEGELCDECITMMSSLPMV